MALNPHLSYASWGNYRPPRLDLPDRYAVYGAGDFHLKCGIWLKNLDFTYPDGSYYNAELRLKAQRQAYPLS